MKAELIDWMGDDLRVANAARVSMNKESDWDYRSSDPAHKKYLKGKDEKLINFLSREDHFTPFTHCVVTLRETVPIFVARQRFKHTVGFTYNEVSRRYVDEPPTFFYPDKWRKRAENVKQGSSDEEVRLYDWQIGRGQKTNGPMYSIKQEYERFLDQCKFFYETLIKLEVAPEQARMVLPQSMYTSYYVTGSLSAWARAYKLRSDTHAQLEIQELAKQWNEIIQPLFPVSWEALTKVK